MKRYILFCLLSLNFVFLFAKENTWHEGSVVLKTEAVLVGEILIEPAYDLILYRIEGKVEVYPAHKIHSLYFYDAESNINRKFISLNESGIFNHHQLLEIVLRGEINIYRRQKQWTRKSPSDAEGFNYYIEHRGHLIDLLKFRNHVYPEMIKSSGSRLSVFMDVNKLNPNSSSDAIKIIRFYNSLEKNDALLAKQ